MIIINKNLKHLPSRMSHWIYLRVYLVRIESFCMHDTIYAFLLNPNQKKVGIRKLTVRLVELYNRLAAGILVICS